MSLTVRYSYLQKVPPFYRHWTNPTVSYPVGLFFFATRYSYSYCSLSLSPHRTPKNPGNPSATFVCYL